MLEYWEEFKTIALTALFNPPFLFLLLVLFFLGKFIGMLTRRLNIWKILILAYIALFMWQPVMNAGPIIGGVFFLGILSNHSRTIFSALTWARGLGDIFFALRYRRAFEEIRRREQEIEERERRLREEERKQAYSQSQQNRQERPGWQQEAKNFRQGAQQQEQHQQSQSKAQQESKQRSSSQRNQQQRQKTQSPPPGGSTSTNSTRDMHLQTLGLKPGRSYTREEIKKAFRASAKRTHPDMGGKPGEFEAVKRAEQWLLAVKC